MSRYTAKKVYLDTIRECCERDCSCYTRSGYNVQYKSHGTDGVLFVCDECYDKKYREQSSQGDVAQHSAPRQTVPPRTETRRTVSRQTDSLGVRRLIRTVNRSVRFIKRALVPVCAVAAAAVIYLGGISFKQPPQLKARADELAARVQFIKDRGVA